MILPAVENEHRHNGGENRRNIHMDNPLHPGSPVTDGRFLQLRADPGQRGQIDDRRISHGLPDAAAYEQSPEHILIPEEIHRSCAEQPNDTVHNTGSHIRYLHQDTYQDNGGNKIRRIGDHLHKLF